MPIEIISGPRAVELVKTNTMSSWPARNSEINRVEPLTAPGFRPTFKIARNEKVFTIGSCFARNVENALLERGFELPSRSALSDDPEFAAIGPNILNNYGVPSIFNEIAWALGLKEFLPEENFFEISPGKFIDIHLNHALRPVEYELVERRRTAIRKAYGKLRECGVVVITLGLAECWYDTQTKLYLNTSPRRNLIRSFPTRFELHVLSFNETKLMLSETMQAIKNHGRADVRVIVTVSPVPLGATYRDHDVIVANMYSKSMLRTCAEEITIENDFVDYFPSFESVLTSARDIVWEDDFVHIRKPVIDLNVSRMVAGYAGSGGETLSSDELVARLRLAETKPGEVFGELESRDDILSRSPEAALLFCEAAVRLRRFAEIEKWIVSLSSDFEPERQAWVLAQWELSKGNFAEVERRLLKHLSAFKRRMAFWRMLLEAQVGMRSEQRVRNNIIQWAAVFPHSAEPYRVGGNSLAKLGDLQGAAFMFRKALAIADGDGQGQINLDFSEFLAGQGKIMMARKALENFAASNPSQAARYEELKLQLNIQDKPQKASV